MVTNCLVLAKVTDVQGTNICYPCCRQCYSKIFQVQDGWSCSKCGNQISNEALHHRYRLSFTICDNKSQCSVTVFGTTLQTFIGCPADALHRWLAEVQSTDDILKTCLNETFTGHMFLFGFKLKTLRNCEAAKNGLVSLADIAEVSVSSEDTKSKSTSLIAYQMLIPNDGVPQNHTVLERLKYYRLLAAGRIKENSFINISSDCDSFMKQRHADITRAGITFVDDQEDIVLSCGSFSKTSFDLSESDKSIDRLSSGLTNSRLTNNETDFELDSQPSIELPRYSQHSFNQVEVRTDITDIPAITEQSQEPGQSSFHCKFSQESICDRTKHLNITARESEVPIFRFFMREESISDSILLQANETGLRETDKLQTDDNENPNASKSESVAGQNDHWTCIPESEELNDFLDQFQSEVNQSSTSLASKADSENPVISESRNESNSSVTPYPMSEDLDAFLSDATPNMHQESDVRNLKSIDSHIQKENNSANNVVPESEELDGSESVEEGGVPTTQILRGENQAASGKVLTEKVCYTRNDGAIQTNNSDLENLWDDDVPSQNLLNAMKDLDGEIGEIEESEEQSSQSHVVVESEDLFASFNHAEINADPAPCVQTPSNGPAVTLRSTSTRRGVHFARSLQSQTLAHIDHLMQTTPMSVASKSRRSSCLRIKPSSETIASPYCAGTLDVSQDLFSPSPIAVVLSKGPDRAIPVKCLYQSTPSSSKSTKQTSTSPQSQDLSSSMDLFSDCSYTSCKQSSAKTGSCSQSQDLFSDDSFEDAAPQLCKKLF